MLGTCFGIKLFSVGTVDDVCCSARGPRLDDRVEILASIFEMPIEAAFRYAKKCGYMIDAELIDSDLSQALQTGSDPVLTRVFLRFHISTIPFGIDNGEHPALLSIPMSMERKLKPASHASLPWRLNEIARDFELVDAWALPVRGDVGQFHELYRTFANLNKASRKESPVSALLFEVRHRLGQRFGWDDAASTNTLPIPGCKETSLRERLPADVPVSSENVFGNLSNFRPVFVIENEAAVEVSNKLVHAILHLGWVKQPDGTYRGQLGVYVKHRGAIGRPYMSAIRPFRHLIVYPALMRSIGTSWELAQHAKTFSTVDPSPNVVATNPTVAPHSSLDEIYRQPSMS